MILKSVQVAAKLLSNHVDQETIVDSIVQNAKCSQQYAQNVENPQWFHSSLVLTNQYSAAIASVQITVN